MQSNISLSPEKQISCFWGVYSIIFLEYPIVSQTRSTKKQGIIEYPIHTVDVT